MTDTPKDATAPDPAVLDGACHCGAVRFRIRLSDGLASARRCTCSYCRMRGAVAVSAPLDGLEITSGAESLTLYTFNTHAAQHHFCKICGIYTHHRRRSNPNELGVNAACLAGVSPFDFHAVKVMDGVNHPNDGAGPRVAGILRFDPA
ncbi:GFA family protein [Solirhodobacter olei]|uniref:GFA family protein n=1 Tax=Solirhodobacter olei TaxID=2493082 RepID=UPI000FD7FE26|nr:GFA family protein [Solirhodobacter olei]